MSRFHSHTTCSEIVEAHLPCEDCGGSDPLTEYTDHTYCFNCGKHKWTQAYAGKRDKDDVIDTDITIGRFATLKDRRITKSVCKRFGVTVKAVKNDDDTHDIVKHYYPYYDTSGKLVAQKIRLVHDKTKMPWEGKPKKAGLFGQQQVMTAKDGKKNVVTITEGELDAMAAYQMFGERHNFISIANGARGAVKDCKTNLQWFDKFSDIYICFDNDEEGQAAAKDVAMLFDGRARIVQLDKGFKDACDYLKQGQEKLFTDTWWKAEPYVPTEIITGQDIIGLIDDYEDKECFSLPWKDLTDMTYGYRLGETWAVTSHAKVGKTSFIRELVSHIIHDDTRNHKVGTIFLEGQAREHALGFLSIEADIPFHLPDAVYTDKDMDDAKASLPVDRLCFYKREGVIDIDAILSVIRYYIRAMDCQVIVLDNLMSLVSDQPTDEERKLLNNVITKVTKLGEDTNTFIMLVAHLNRQTGLIHGTSLLEKLAWTVLELSRDLDAEDFKERNTTMVSVKYNRFSGDTGPCMDLFYEKSTGRMVERHLADKTNKKKKTPTKDYRKKNTNTAVTVKPKERPDEFEDDKYEEPDVD